jgi:hypothetical protein
MVVLFFPHITDKSFKILRIMTSLLANHASEARTPVWIFVYVRAKYDRDELICVIHARPMLKRSELEFQERRTPYHHMGGSGIVL